MILELSAVVFENDFFNLELPDGNSILVLNKINEAIKSNESKELKINRINIQVTRTIEDTGETEYVMCPSVIGLSNDILRIYTEHTEMEGKVLTSDNMKYCRIEIYE